MEQLQEASDEGIELFVSIPVYSSDPHFLRAMQQRSKGEDFRSIKRQARSERTIVSVSNQLVHCVNQGSKGQMDGKGGLCGSHVLPEREQSRFTSSPSSSSLSSSSLSSSVSDLFTFDENDMMEFIDERSKPRYRLLTEFY
ncbi:hypothetical protein GOP47_0017879 [Adiantum capillus-veneris]|uniref:Uncharacterized protein n=1 Tax=Adiantum capillus-veneris TaxID=13818 RepID=A0A9D4UHD6_ADICA|nr:hypothetical protein GOP47_0017879 [Adiantum capillus-veneris]